jgi:hypothetical protein
MKDIGVPSQSDALLKRMLKGFGKIEPMNHHRLGDFGQQVCSIDGRKTLHIKCECIPNLQAIRDLVSNIYNRN